MILLDTHVILWWQAGGGLLSRRAAREIAAADAVLISPMSCWEIGMLLNKQRISLDRDLHLWIRDLLQDDQIELAPLTAHVAVTASMLVPRGFHGDPVDQLLYATALELLIPLVTKDSGISSFAATAKDVRTVW